MATGERGGGGDVLEEGERLLMEEMTMLDFDMLCSAVALQAEGRKLWNNQQEGVTHGGGALVRMWEGELIHDCFDNREIALQSTFCPCYRFGKNMKRAGLGSCFFQGFIHFILVALALAGLLAFLITKRECFLYLSVSFGALLILYMGVCRMHIRKKFNIKGGRSSLDDFAYHLICPCCTLCQESRTLEMNNVRDGTWHGRGDTICVGSLSNLDPHYVVSVNSPSPLTMQKMTTDDGLS